MNGAERCGIKGLLGVCDHLFQWHGGRESVILVTCHNQLHRCGAKLNLSRAVVLLGRWCELRQVWK
jgi:hypothetical protein